MIEPDYEPRGRVSDEFTAKAGLTRAELGTMVSAGKRVWWYPIIGNSGFVLHWYAGGSTDKKTAYDRLYAEVKRIYYKRPKIKDL